MPSRSGNMYNDYYDYYDADHKPSRSPRKFKKPIYAVNNGHFDDAKGNSKSAVIKRGTSGELEPYDYYDYYDRPGRRYHGDQAYHCRHSQHNYPPRDDHGRRGRSLQSVDDYYRWERDRSRHHRQPRARSHSENRVKEAATAALAAGLTEAVRSRHHRDQSKRAITAAVGAAAVDAFVSNGEDQKKGRHIAESAVSGLLIDRLANGRSKH